MHSCTLHIMIYIRYIYIYDYGSTFTFKVYNRLLFFFLSLITYTTFSRNI